MMMIDLMMVVAAAVVGTVMVGVWAMEEAVEPPAMFNFN